MSLLYNSKNHQKNTYSFTNSKYSEYDDIKDSSTTQNSIFQQKNAQTSHRFHLKIKKIASIHKGFDSTNFSNQFNKIEYPQVRQLKNIINSGKYIYMNVIGSEQQHLRALSPQKVTNNGELEQAVSFFGCEYPHLSSQQKQMLNYLNNQYQSKCNEVEIKKIIKDKFIKINKKLQNSRIRIKNENKQLKSSQIKLVTPPIPSQYFSIKRKIVTQQSRFNSNNKNKQINITLRQKLNNGFKKMLLTSGDFCKHGKSFQKKVKDKQQYYLAKWIKDQRQINSKNRSFDVNNIKLQNLEKYDIEFTDYLKRKTDRKIQKDKIDRIINKKENLIQQYQQHILNQINVPIKNKQNIRKHFQEINNQTRRIRKL